MPAAVEIKVCYGPGQVISMLRDWWAPISLYVGDPANVAAVTLTTYDGYRALVALYTELGIPAKDWTLVLTTLPDTAVAPADYFLRSPGWSGVTLGAYWDGSGPYSDWATVVDSWNNLIIGTKRSMLTSWTDGSITPEQQAELSTASGRARCIASQCLVTAGASVVPSSETLSGTNGNTPGTSWGQFGPAAPGVDGNPILVGSDSSSIVAAIEQLGNIDTTISFNQGAAVYSIKNREVTGP